MQFVGKQEDLLVCRKPAAAVPKILPWETGITRINSGKPNVV